MKPIRLHDEIDSDVICRICLETQTTENPLIVPCKCAGTVGYIHESCLKVWLISKELNLNKVRCELCKTKYEMAFVFKSLCVPKKLFRENFVHWLFLPLLGLVFCLLILISGIILTKLSKDKGERAYVIVLLGTCALGCLIIVFMCYSSIREACFSEELTSWSIKSRNDMLEKKSHENSSSTAIFDVGASNISDVLNVPQTVKIGHRVIKTPQIQSMSFTPISSAGAIVGYTSRLRSDRMSVDVSRRAYNTARIEEVVDEE